MITAQQLAERRNTLGSLLHTSAAVTDAPADILPDEPERIRRKLIVTNTGTDNVTLALGETAIAGRGIVLQPTQSARLAEGEAFSGRISAVCAAGESSTVAIFAATATE